MHPVNDFPTNSTAASFLISVSVKKSELYVELADIENLEMVFKLEKRLTTRTDDNVTVHMCSVVVYEPITVDCLSTIKFKFPN